MKIIDNKDPLLYHDRCYNLMFYNSGLFTGIISHSYLYNKALTYYKDGLFICNNNILSKITRDIKLMSENDFIRFIKLKAFE